jgi:hypothetical protein
MAGRFPSPARARITMAQLAPGREEERTPPARRLADDLPANDTRAGATRPTDPPHATLSSPGSRYS